MCDGQLTNCKKSGKSEQGLVGHSVALEEDEMDVSQHLNNINNQISKNILTI